MRTGRPETLAARLESFRHAVAGIKIDLGNGESSQPVRISGGVSFCPAEREEADALIKLADDRLYAAKDGGRDRIYLDVAPRSNVS